MQYVGNPETVHFVNWVLYSGQVDFGKLMKKAEQFASKEGKKKAWAKDVPNCRCDCVASALAVILAEQAVKFCPEYCLEGHDFGDCQDDYKDGNNFYLFAPLLTHVINRIHLGFAARGVLAHIYQQESGN